MTNKRMTKRRNNPTVRKQPRVPRPVSQFDGSVLNGSHITTSAVATANQYGEIFYISCNDFFGTAQQNFPLLKYYQEYKYLKLSMTLLPAQGPSSAGAPGRIYVAYTDSPELMVNFQAMTDVQQIAAVKGMRDMKAYNLWERFTYNVPLTNRVKQFNVDTAMVVTSTSELSRACQGGLLIAAETVGATDQIGQFRFLYTIQTYGLTNTATV